jgi:hypothetical protein
MAALRDTMNGILAGTVVVDVAPVPQFPLLDSPLNPFTQRMVAVHDRKKMSV